EGFADDDRDVVADVAYGVEREGRVRRRFHRRAVLRMDHPTANETAELVGGELFAGEDAEHTGHARRLGGVDRLDAGGAVRAAHEIGVSLTGPREVVCVVAEPGDEALVFLAAHGGADTGLAHALAPFISSEAALIALTMLW